MLLKNLYSLKDYGRIWFDFLKDELIDRDWEKLTTGTHIFTKSGITLIVYVANAILLSPYESRI